MAHPRRVFVPGVSWHVRQRGHNCETVFHDRDDFTAFIDLVREQTQAADVSVHGLSVLNTHYHLLVTPNTPRALATAMQTIDGGYSRYYNRRRNRLGTIWNGRYKAKAIEDERYWLTCLRYVDQNPVEAGIVSNPEDYEWSSYRVHIGQEKSTWIVSHPVFDALGDTDFERHMKYRILCADGIPRDYGV